MSESPSTLDSTLPVAPPPSSEQPVANVGARGLIARLYWVFIGPMGVFVVGLLIVRDRLPWLTGADLACLILAISIPLVRWVDARFLGGSGLDGEPVGAGILARHALLVAIISGAWWALAHIAGQMGLL